LFCGYCKNFLVISHHFQCGENVDVNRHDKIEWVTMEVRLRCNLRPAWDRSHFVGDACCWWPLTSVLNVWKPNGSHFYSCK
jgi:hypothetical protein